MGKARTSKTISLAAGLQLAASIPNFLCQEQVSLGDGYIKKPFRVVDGYVDLPRGPGLGIELDDDAIHLEVRDPQDATQVQLLQVGDLPSAAGQATAR